MSEVTMEMTELKTVKEGDLVTGIIVSIDNDGLLLDIGIKAEAIVPVNQLHIPAGSCMEDVFSKGQELEAVVLKSDSDEGQPVLSQKKAAVASLWRKINEMYERGENVEIRITKSVKGGLLGEIEGIESFMPASQATLRRGEDTSSMVGNCTMVRIIEVDSAKRKVIVSRRRILVEEAEEKRRQAIDSLQEGTVIKGVVRRLADFGAFVDVGGVDGLLHVSDMSWTRIKHPRDVVKVDDEIEVGVQKVDKESGKISLSLKQVLRDPWEDVERNFKPGALVEATITRVVSFGAFARLTDDGVEGLVPISELSYQRIEKAEDVIKPGQKIILKVLSASYKSRRISLSLKQVADDQEKAEMKTYMKDQTAGDNPTLGDLFGDLLSGFKEE
ncbi:MAG: 30S ribosomal protein S1 [bacterium]|jgi:small subunit ribosomal protein S1|nr:30S ribosomal protein S1 [bacterium]